MSRELYVPENFLAECQDLQRVINDVPDPAQKDELGYQFRAALFGRAEYYGHKRIIVRSMAAFVLSTNEQHAEDASAGLQMTDVVARGHLGNVTYFRFGENATLAWPIYDARVMNTEVLDAEDIDPMAQEFGHYMPTERPSRLPVHMPVSMIDYALCAA